MRNKAAERAKVNYNNSTGSSSSSGNGSTNNPTSSASPSHHSPISPTSSSGGGNQPSVVTGVGGSGLESILRPSYSINGILGIHQPDANANNINKRKREDEGKEIFILKNSNVQMFANCSQKMQLKMTIIYWLKCWAVQMLDVSLVLSYLVWLFSMLLLNI